MSDSGTIRPRLENYNGLLTSSSIVTYSKMDRSLYCYEKSCSFSATFPVSFDFPLSASRSTASDAQPTSFACLSKINFTALFASLKDFSGGAKDENP